VTAITDHEGQLLFFGRMDGALPISRELAVAKAYTAATLRMPTHDVGRLAQPGAALYGIQNTHPGKIVLFGGGLPLRLEGVVVGAVGISGGTVEEDILVAERVVDSLRIMEETARLLKEFIPINSDVSGLKALNRLLVAEFATLTGQAWNKDWEPILTGALYLAGIMSENTGV
jgi:uncharacterized protein GlcG (DUF336 family)